MCLIFQSTAYGKFKFVFCMRYNNIIKLMYITIKILILGAYYKTCLILLTFLKIFYIFDSIKFKTFIIVYKYIIIINKCIIILYCLSIPIIIVIRDLLF